MWLSVAQLKMALNHKTEKTVIWEVWMTRFLHFLPWRVVEILEGHILSYISRHVHASTLKFSF